MQTILDKSGIQKVFGISEGTLRTQYKSWPHFYVCEGRDLRSARFILEKVIEHLELANANERQKTGYMDRQSATRRVSPKQKARLQNPGGSGRVGADTAGDDPESTDDPFNLLSVCK